MQAEYVGFPLNQETRKPAVKWSVPANLRPIDEFLEGEMFGFPTGPRNGFWVLDLDEKNGKSGSASLEDWMTEHGVEEALDTYTVRTRSGGLHLYFAWPAPDSARPVVRNRIGVLPGVDVRGAGGYVVAGGPYLPVDPDKPMAEAPAWLLELVTAGNDEAAVPQSAIAITPDHPEWARRIALAEKFLAALEPAISGINGQKTIWKAGLRLCHEYELPVNEAVRLVELHWNPRCAPPWDCADLARTFARAAKLGHGPSGTAPAGWALAAAPEDPPGKSAGEDPTGKSAGARRPPGMPPWARLPVVPPSAPHAYTWDLATHARDRTEKLTPIDDHEIIAIFAGETAHPDWLGVWQFDEFTRRTFAVRPPMRLDAETERFSSYDATKVHTWVAHQGAKTKRTVVEHAIAAAASVCRTHAVRLYLANLPAAPTTSWLADGTMGRLFADDAPPEASDFARKWMIGCVARAMRPGCQFDTVLTLCGELGGERKSAFFRSLCPVEAWYRSNLPDIANAQLIGQAARAHWVVELGELATLGRAQVEAFKEFIVRTVEKFNEKYEKQEAIEPRQFGLAATTNRIQFLDNLDSALRRRFWPIQVTVGKIDTSWVETHRDELWAEAYAAWRAGEAWWYEDEQAVDKARDAFNVILPTEEILDAYMADPNLRRTLHGRSASEIAATVLKLQGVATSQQRDLVAKLLARRADVRLRRSATRRWYEFEGAAAAAAAALGGPVLPFSAGRAG